MNVQETESVFEIKWLFRQVFCFRATSARWDNWKAITEGRGSVRELRWRKAFMNPSYLLVTGRLVIRWLWLGWLAWMSNWMLKILILPVFSFVLSSRLSQSFRLYFFLTLFIYRSVCLYFPLSVCMSVYMYVCMCVWLSTWIDWRMWRWMGLYPLVYSSGYSALFSVNLPTPSIVSLWSVWEWLLMVILPE